MKITKLEKDKVFELPSKQLSSENISNLNKPIIQKILDLLKNETMYPKQIAKNLSIHEQNIYYHIKKLKQIGIIEIKKEENINGTIAQYYGLTSQSFFYKIGEFEETTKPYGKVPNYLKPFLDEGKLNAIIVVGSPDPHGPLKARSKDGYFGMDFALFLGTFLNSVPSSKVRLDTEITNKELEENNLIVIGGPIVNKVTSLINDKTPIYFDQEKKGIYSSITKKIYFNEECGFVNKCNNPFNKNKEILQIVGIRNSGTKSTILAFLKYFDEIQKGNSFDNKVDSKVVEGIDFDSDGIVDDCEFLE